MSDKNDNLTVGIPLGIVENLAEEFHIASANSIMSKRSRAAQTISYDDSITKLVEEAPLKISSSNHESVVSLSDLFSADDETDVAALRRVIEARRSGREFSEDPMTEESLRKLLYLANGVQSKSGSFYRRNAPSAGGMGSVEIFPIVLNVAGVERGIYHFNTVSHGLSLLHAGDFSDWLRLHALFQVEFSEAAVVLVLTSAVGRLSQKYGLRGYRLALLDAGHVSQNIYLTATAMDLEVCATGGFVDGVVNRALDLDGLDRCAVLVLGVGKRK